MLITDLKILKGVPFNADDNKIVTFDNASQQFNFFSSFSFKSFTNIMFVKGFLYKKIKLDVKYEDIKYCNYIMFINRQDNTSKWNYAYIKNFEYISDNCTYIEIEIDYFQTYMGQIVFAPSYIEREMTELDTLDNEENFIAEPDIDLQNYVITGIDQHLYTEWFVCICYKANLVLQQAEDTLNILAAMFRGDSTFKYADFISGDYETFFNMGGGYYNKYITGCSYKLYEIRNDNEMKILAEALTKLETLGYSIVNVYMVPKTFRNPQDLLDTFALNNTKNQYYTNKTINYGNFSYIPVNSKCFTTPYIYLELTNMQSEYKKYSYQYFLRHPQTPPDFIFTIYGCFFSRFDAVCFPSEYKAIIPLESAMYDYGLSIGETPECQWNNSLANAVKGAAKTLFNVIADTAMMSAGMPPTNTMTQAMEKAQTSKQIEGAGGIAQTIFNNTDNSTKGVPAMPILQVITNKIGFLARQYASVNIVEIDQYFSMFGYRITKYKTPNILGRRRYNYIKMNDPIIVGTIPINARNYVMNKLREGVTFWHDKNDFSYGTFRGQYSNEIVNKTLNNGIIFQN